MRFFKTLCLRQLEVCSICKKVFEFEEVRFGELYCREHREQKLKEDAEDKALLAWINKNLDEVKKLREASLIRDAVNWSKWNGLPMGQFSPGSLFGTGKVKWD